ncbi:hypothetical protein BY458DRAFT_504712 [Sporodiniella umbellata]|nr:hypothetical protein BY458DRAFT_504712 [Sporodiniella umbellata]
MESAMSEQEQAEVEIKKRLAKSFENLDSKLKDLELTVQKQDARMEAIEKETQEKQKLLLVHKQKVQEAHDQVKTIQKKLYDSTKTIQVTDDDYSTIQAKLAQLSGKVASLPVKLKPFYKKEQAYGYFSLLWPDCQCSLDRLMTDPSDYALISLLVEKRVMEVVVSHILDTEIFLNPQINQAFSAMETVFIKTQHAHWIPDLRHKCAKATLDILQHQPHSDLASDSTHTKAELVQSLIRDLSRLYEPNEEIQPRLEKIVDMASQIILPVRGQEDPLVVHHLQPGQKVIPNQVKAQYKCIGKENTILLGISPVFLTKTVHDPTENAEEEPIQTYEKDCTVVYSGKAIW